MMKRLFGVLALCLGAAFCFAMIVGVSTAAGAAVSCPTTRMRTDARVGAIGRLDAEQLSNARTVVATALDRGMGPRAAVIALATALQESSLRNIPYGDRDSLGLFQQRPSAGWGSAEQILDPVQATDSFLGRLRDVPGWTQRPLTDVAQEVQRSAYPRAYARWEPIATRVVLSLVEPSAALTNRVAAAGAAGTDSCTVTGPGDPRG
jgi:hypothetical protein